MKSLKVLLCIGLLGWHFTASAERIKDVSMVEGVRSNQLVGYGLVVGLPGTGEKSSAFTEQAFSTMLRNFGINVPPGETLKIKKDRHIFCQKILYFPYRR